MRKKSKYQERGSFVDRRVDQTDQVENALDQLFSTGQLGKQGKQGKLGNGLDIRNGFCGFGGGFGVGGEVGI